MKQHAVLVLALVALTSNGCESRVVVPGLYSYAYRDQISAAQRAGLPPSWHRLRRNSDGSRLYWHFEYDRRVLVLAAGGPSRVLEAPGLVSYLNDAGEFVAWSENASVGFRLANGSFVSTSGADGGSGSFGVDPGGSFYFLTRARTRTLIAPITTPDAVIAESAFQGEYLFARGNRLYLFGRVFDGQSSRRELFGDIFEKRSSTWMRVRSLTISRGREASSPFNVVDMEPWAEQILIIDAQDPPFQSRLYLYDLETGQRTRVAIDQSGALLFLKGDLLREAQ